jgi:hypothetical protein
MRDQHCARENANGARAKSGGRTIPAGPDLIRTYADYLTEGYGSAQSDYGRRLLSVSRYAVCMIKLVRAEVAYAKFMQISADYR